jgi:iron complex transport system permease protein
VAILVSKTGVIGFVGLLVPHAARKMRGARHRPLVLFAALSGAIFMIWADTAARTLFSPEEIPVGILTAMIGAPVFVWIVQRGYTFGGQE